MKKTSTFDLIDQWFDLQEEMDILEEEGYLEEDGNWNFDMHLEKLKALEASLIEKFKTKVENIDKVIIRTETEVQKLKAHKNVLAKEVSRINRHIKQREKLATRMKEVLIPAIIEVAGKDGVLHTNTARYKIMQKWNEASYDPDKVPDMYVRRMERVIDKATLRKDAIAAAKNNESIPGISYEEGKTIRRS